MSKKIVYFEGKGLESRDGKLYFDGRELSVGGGYALIFAESDLTAGVLTVTHNLGQKVLPYAIADGSAESVTAPVTFIDANTLEIDLSVLSPISGLWTVCIGGVDSDFVDSIWSQYISAQFLLNFDTNADDESLDPLTFTENGSPTYPAGKFAEAISLDGSTQYLETPNTPFDPLSGSDTWSFGGWVNVDSISGDKCIAEIGKFSDATNKGLLVRISNDDFQIWTGSALFQAFNIVAASQWNHFLVVHRDSRMDLYWNGERTTVRDIFSTTDLNFSAAPVRIGRANHNNADWFDGLIDSLVWLPNLVAETDGFRPPSVAYARDAGVLNDAPRYANPLGSGDRTLDGIVLTSDLTIGGGSITELINGVETTGSFYWNSQTVAGKHITVEFPQAVAVDRIRMLASGSNAFGTWQPQVSNNGSDWTNIDTTQTVNADGFIDFALNDTAYKYYRILGDSGSIASLVNYEWLFRIAPF